MLWAIAFDSPWSNPDLFIPKKISNSKLSSQQHSDVHLQLTFYFCLVDDLTLKTISMEIKMECLQKIPQPPLSTEKSNCTKYWHVPHFCSKVYTNISFYSAIHQSRYFQFFNVQQSFNLSFKCCQSYQKLQNAQSGGHHSMFFENIVNITIKMYQIHWKFQPTTILDYWPCSIIPIIVIYSSMIHALVLLQCYGKMQSIKHFVDLSENC